MKKDVQLINGSQKEIINNLATNYKIFQEPMATNRIWLLANWEYLVAMALNLVAL